jgi:hypothetical protein
MNNMSEYKEVEKKMERNERGQEIDDLGFTQLDRDIDHIWEKLRDLVREMDRDFGDERIYKSWLEMVAFQGDLASFTLQAMDRGEYDES